jgi:hypothetical protein
MSEQNVKSSTDEISIQEVALKLKNWYKYLLTKWVLIVSAGLIGAILGLSYAYFRKLTYTAECTFVLEEGDSGGGLGDYAGLASMVGIDLGGGGGGIFKGDNILQLYKSRKMIEETLLARDTFNNKTQLLINRFIDFNELQGKWIKKVDLSKLDFSIPKSQFSRSQDSVINVLVTDINKNYLSVAKIDKKLSIIKVSFINKDEQFAKSFTDNIVQKVNQFYIETKTKKSSENLNILQKQADSVKAVLNRSIGGVASAVDANPNMNPAFQTLRVPSQRRQVDVQASGAVYQEIVKNLEMAKITFRKEKPLIQIIDEPVFPLESDRVGLLIGAVIGAVIFEILILMFLFIKMFVKAQ